MANRFQLLFGIGAVTLCYIVVQLSLYQNGPSQHSLKGNQRWSSTYDVMKHFLSYCNDSRVQCILVDPTALKLFVTNTAKENNKISCRYLCQNHVYTIAVRDTDFQTLNTAVLSKLRTSGFNIRMTFSELEQKIPTHINLQYSTHSIHVAILHWKGSWWWCNADLNKKTVVDFSKYDRTIDSFDYRFQIIDDIPLYVPNSPKHFLSIYERSRFIPCNKTRAELFHKEHSKDTSEDAARFRKKAANAIAAVKSVLDANGTPFWLSSGTLLGWYRQCDFIPYSVDVDIGVFIKDHTNNMRKTLSTSFHLEHKFGKINDSLQYAFDMDGIKLDIFFFYEDPTAQKVWNGGTEYSTGEKYKYLFDKFSLCWTEFNDMRVRVPCDTETYIRANYGDNWFYPVKHWEWNKSPPNVVPNGEWNDDELDEAIQLWDKDGKRIPLEWTRDD